jgi:SpoIID/LytB domain protein
VDPGFSPRFAFFTFGAPHRVGLNQYGAYGRAKAGQSYDTILHAYYNFDELKDYDTNTKIKVDGQGEFSLEDYVKRIYEVPNDWGDNGGMEALKAQAIAARSYALAYTHNGADSICTTEECQVFQPNEKGGNWGSAVDATRGKVMMQGGNPVKAWFASTHGGYGFSSAEVGWSGTAWTKNFRDTSGDVNSFQDLMDKAYDKDSPWFYCDWGSRSEYHNTAWLKSEEVADIANALMLAKADGSVASHLSQPDKPNPDGTDTWDRDRVKKELRDRGGSPFNSVSDIGIDWDKGSGKTTNVKISGDAGSKDFNPGEWKNFFNVRAPANIQIVGPLFNIEKR